MRTHKCKRCGSEYETDKPWSYFCPACALQAKQDSVVRRRTCRQCGTTFEGGPRAWYCPNCRTQRRKAADQKHKKCGTNRPLGSTDHCLRCGKAYIVNSGRQMYCPDCSKEAVQEKVKLHKRAYNAANSDKFHARRKEMLFGVKVCAVCGKPIISDTPTVTCSPECSAEQMRRVQGLADYKRGRRSSTPGDKRYDSGLPKSGITGVTARRNGRWQATYKGHYIGVFDTIDAASDAIEDYRKDLK